MTNIDKLYDAVAQKGNVCVGLDTAVEYLPEGYLAEGETAAEGILRFNKAIVDATCNDAACYKVQIAYYEALGVAGLVTYAKTLEYLRQKGLLAIADIKRGDIANTAEMYAKGHFEGEFEADFITLSPYMGLDSIAPYEKYFNTKGAFVLVRTSNDGAKDFEYETLAGGARVYDLVGDKLATLGEKYIGKRGYSSVGMVIGGTHIEEAASIRAKYAHSFFLIPGYGAQGGTAADIAQYLVNGNGGVVNSSRAILLAYKKLGGDFALAAQQECINMREAIKHECDALRV